MKTNEATRLLKSMGWSIYTDEVGDKFSSFTLPDRIVNIIYGIRRNRNSEKFFGLLSLTTVAFAQACSEVRGEEENCPLIRSWEGISVTAPEIFEEHVRQASEEAISWASKQDLEKALWEHAALPTSAPGARPIWHLAALAILGDVAKLRSYQASFEAGDRLGFVPYIRKEDIDRAVALAEFSIASK